MATDNDLTYGREIPTEVLDQVHASFPGDYIDDSDPANMVAAVVKLDELLGLSEEGDKLVLDPSIGMWVLLAATVVAPPELANLHQKLVASMTEEGDDEAPEDDSQNEAAYNLLTSWFKVSFDAVNPESKEPYQYHPSLHGKTFTVRFLTDEERHDAQFFCATVHADGTVVQAGQPSRVFK